MCKIVVRSSQAKNTKLTIGTGRKSFLHRYFNNEKYFSCSGIITLKQSLWNDDVLLLAVLVAYLGFSFNDSICVIGSFKINANGIPPFDFAMGTEDFT